MVQNKGFTLLEILLVLSVIGLIIGMGVFSLSQTSKNSRDAIRKADLQTISQALETYKSNDTYSSYPFDIHNLETQGYLKEVPSDPDLAKGDYVYSTTCTNQVGATNGKLCTTYTLTATLDSSSSYTIGPLGQTTPLPTSAPTATSTPAPPASCTSICTSQGQGQHSCRNSCSGSWNDPEPNPPSTCSRDEVCCCKP